MKEKINILNVFITAVIGGLVTLFLDLIMSKPFLSTISYVAIASVDVLAGALKVVINFLTMDIKLWVILLLLLLVKTIKVVIVNLTSRKSSENNKRAFEMYTEDRLKNWRWTWKWVLTGGSWVIRDLTPYCPKCGSTLLQHDNKFMGEYSVQCPKCSFSRRYIDDERPDKIGQMIIDKANKMDNESLDYIS